MTMIHDAAREGNAQQVLDFLRRGCGVNLQDAYGQTPLHYAAASGHIDVARVLLEQGANVNSQMQGQYTPLHMAAYAGNVELTQLLLDAKPDLAAQDQDGFTPLHDATRKGHTDVVRLLLAAGASMDARSLAGWRPKELAQKSEIRELLKEAHFKMRAESADDGKQGALQGSPRSASFALKVFKFNKKDRSDQRDEGMEGALDGGCLRVSSFTAPQSNENPQRLPHAQPSPITRAKSKLGSAVVESSNPSASTSTAGRDALTPWEVLAKNELLLNCQEYTYEDLGAATQSFSEGSKCGSGGYGSVYRGQLNFTPVAIKVIDAASLQGMDQFYQEVAVLGRIRHPHIVQLLGVCRDRGCLVYEMMDNGTLEDHLAGKRPNSHPFKWVERLQIATDVSSAVLFLHKARPHPILHRDIKPANILLDHSLSAKLGDVGLSKLVPELSTQSTVRTTAPIGTYAYMDPAYLTEGIVGSFTDVYALGITFLQLLLWVGEPVGIRKTVLDALESNTIGDLLDDAMKGQSLSEVKSFAQLALRCCSMRREERPSLESEVIPAMAEILRMAQVLTNPGPSPNSSQSTDVPDRFICPITQDVMEDPVVASDGFTYERIAIQRWMAKTATSPMTRQRLHHRPLYTNMLLRSELSDWKAENPNYLETN